MKKKTNQEELNNSSSFNKLIESLSHLHWREMLELSKIVDNSYRLAFEGRAVQKRFGNLTNLNNYIQEILNAPEGGTWDEELKLVRIVYAYNNKDNIPFSWKYKNSSLSTAWKHVVGLRG